MIDPTRAISKTFVVWDSTIRGLDILLSSLPEIAYEVLGIDPRGGSIPENVLRKGLERADRVLAFVDKPNVNVAFELGYALALRNKPVAILHTTKERPAWVRRPPLAGLACQPIRSRDEVLNLVDAAFMTAPNWHATDEGTLFLCSSGIAGSAIAYIALNVHSDWRVLPEQGWNLTGISEKLSGIRRVVWVLPQISEEVLRDGDEDAALGAIAGFATGAGAELGVLAHKSRRPFLDLEDRVHLYETPNEFERILETFAGHKQPSRRSQPPIRMAGTIDFSPLLNRKLQDFVGRKWLTSAVDSFLKEHDRGYIVVRSQPGLGKTSFAASLVRSFGWIHHFVSRAHGVVGFDQFLKNLHSQLAHALGTPLEEPGGVAYTHGLYLEQMLQTASATLAPIGGRITVVLDGLDEALQLKPGASPLFLPNQLPSGVVMVVTERLGAPEPFLPLPPCLIEIIRPDDERNREDVQAFFENACRGPLSPLLSGGPAQIDPLVERLMEASRGNFMYARSVVDDMLAGRISPDDPAALPQGLEGYHEQHWRLIRGASTPREWERIVIPVLCVLAAVDHPLDLASLRRVVAKGFPEIADLSEVSLLSALEPCRQFLNSEADATGLRFQIYHYSFRVFLQGKEEIGGELARRRVHTWIAESILEDLDRGQTNAR